MPGDALRFVFNQVGERSVVRGRSDKTPPDPSRFRPPRQFLVSAGQMRRVPHRIRLRCDEAGRNFQPVSDANDEKSWSRLWHEAHRVNNNCAKFVFPADDCRANRRESLTFMRTECTTNIFKNDDGRRAPLFAELLHEAPERPESP